jgi:tripartite-type tricarboxylate transporter receptor subunit TctC
MRRRDFLTAAVALGVGTVFIVPALAQGYPTRPIKMIVGLAPGGTTDNVARLIGQRLSSSLGQPVIIDNRPGGAGGSTGFKAAAAAASDGYTLLSATAGMTISPALYKNVGYDPIKSFAPVAMVASSSQILVVNAAVPAKSVPELVAYAKANPGKVHFGSPGYGTQPHLTGEFLKLRAGIDIIHVPYRGSAPAVNDLLAGQIQMMLDAGPTVLPQIEAGKLRALAVTGEGRNQNMPDVPTMIESGFPGFTTRYWNGVVAPAGTPDLIGNKLHAAINEQLKSPDMQASLAKVGLEPTVMSPQDFAVFIAAETQKWAAVVKAAGIKIE